MALLGAALALALALPAEAGAVATAPLPLKIPEAVCCTRVGLTGGTEY
jgi:hypothetical protein